MAIPILNHLDLRSASELQNAILHKTTTGSASNVEGKVIYDTGTNTLQYYSAGVSGGSAGWVELDGKGAESFKTVKIGGPLNGQADIVADSDADQLQFNGTAGEIEISSNASTDTVTIGLPNNVTISGNLTVNGTTTTVNSTTVQINDPIFTLSQGNAELSSDDGKDRGIEFKYYDSSARTGFFGYDNSADEFVYFKNASNSSEVFSGTYGNARFGTVRFTSLNYNGTAITTSAAELNLIDGGTARGTTAVANGDGFLHNDGGTMRMTNVSKLADLFAGTNLNSTSGVMSVNDATSGQKGVVQLASSAVTRTGTDTSKAVTPDGLAARYIHATIDVSNSDFTTNLEAVITHGLGTEDLFVSCFDSVTKQQVFPEISFVNVSGTASTTILSVNFSAAPSNDIEVIINSAQGSTAASSIVYGASSS